MLVLVCLKPLVAGFLELQWTVLKQCFCFTRHLERFVQLDVSLWRSRNVHEESCHVGLILCASLPPLKRVLQF